MKGNIANGMYGGDQGKKLGVVSAIDINVHVRRNRGQTGEQQGMQPDYSKGMNVVFF